MKKASCAALFLVLCAAVCPLGGTPASAADAEGGLPPVLGPAPAEQDLVIPLDAVTDKASFIPATAAGTRIELIAVRGSGGEPRLAYNTCQICKGSPLAFFAVKGDVLVCANCGNAFGRDAVGADSRGCTPLPVRGARIEKDHIRVPAAELAAAAGWFRNWKRGLGEGR